MSGPGGMGTYCFMGTELQFYKVKKVLGIDGSGVICPVPMYLIPPNCTLKNGNLYVTKYFTTVTKKWKEMEGVKIY